jgi:hypothetical protein
LAGSRERAKPAVPITHHRIILIKEQPAATARLVANQSRRQRGPRTAEAIAPAIRPTIAVPGVAPGKPPVSRHRDIAKAITRRLAAVDRRSRAARRSDRRGWPLPR